ncbi:M24 family metallopeptidase [Falsiroseomonas stagni]|uniref:Creatinase/Prolidase N-terminal domain-containing protein n=1 Tax=Falsiroseomonas stagni DSM 19981 TaxID=1123062 RepID=A0A1I4CBK0_9PROT|nr:Xaa-Pro peptidase family protein [Falsiroseomonas stagni]SFK78315.1 Creatinase/Prolidase N-terminal domain-containing protein [Falsiroseomonas stagni DSM 19981]
MSKHDFTRDEFADRVARARRAVADAGLDWLVVLHPVSLFWLTGGEAKSYQSFQCLLLAAEDRPLTLLSRGSDIGEWRDDAWVDDAIPWGGPEPEDPIEAFATLAGRHGLTTARVGIEMTGYYLHPHHYTRMKDLLGDALVAEPATLLHDIRARKSPAELAHVREAARHADAALAACLAVARPGCTELAMAGEAYRALLASGCGLPASTMNLVTGERLCYAHGAPTQRVMRAGDGGNIELGAAFRRYTATLGRDFCLGTPSARYQHIHDVVRAAGDAMIAAIRPGVPAIGPHLAAKRIIAEAGFDAGRLHTSGYGLAPGFPPSWGEPLNMFGGATGVIEEGMVLTIEPPIFLHKERLGARLIDNVIVTATGATLLSEASRDIIRV